MIYLFVTPMALGLGVYFVPLQVGAAELAWPRLALLGSWLFLGGGVTMYMGFLTNGGPGRAGWTAFDPLSNAANTPGIGMDLWVFGVALPRPARSCSPRWSWPRCFATARPA